MTASRVKSPKAAFIDYAGYNGCPVLANADTRVVLGPHCGGRVLEYSRRGINSIYLDPAQDGWTWTPGKPTINPAGGRLDVGPEMVLPDRPRLWLGPWAFKFTGPRKARMTSPKDDATGLQLTRDFELAPKGSRLKVTQTMKNVSKHTVECYHWSRTLATPNGVAFVPLTEPSRFPRKYLMYTPEAHMDYRPADPNIEIRDGFWLVNALPKYPKLVLDSYAGWFAYLMTNGLLFVKSFKTYPNRVYGDMPGTTVCIYYHQSFCELEPIGPLERLAPGKSASFTEDWRLLDFPKPSGPIDLDAVKRCVNRK